MGKPIKRLNPKIKTKADRNIKELAIRLIANVVLELPPPRKDREKGRKAYPAKPMAAILSYKQMFGLSFDEMESELRVVPIITKVVGLQIDQVILISTEHQRN